MTAVYELQVALLRMDAAKKALLECLVRPEAISNHQHLLREMSESMGEFIRLLREPMQDRDE